MRLGWVRLGSAHRACYLEAWTDAGCLGSIRPGLSRTLLSGRLSTLLAHMRVLAALRCGSIGLRAPHPTRLETRTKESDMRASRRVLKPGRRKEADERVITAGRP